MADDPWEDLLDYVASAVARPDFDERERTDKVEKIIAEAVREVVDSASMDTPWLKELQSIWGRRKFDGQPYNLTNWRIHNDLKKWVEKNPSAAAEAVAAFRANDEPWPASTVLPTFWSPPVSKGRAHSARRRDLSWIAIQFRPRLPGVPFREGQCL